MNQYIKIFNNISDLKAYNPKSGELMFCMNTSELYIGNKNQCFSRLNLDKHKTNNYTKPTNCKNCGAVLTSYKCEYCGTEY